MQENHIVNHPLVLLEFLQHITRDNFTPVPLPFNFSFVIEHTYDSITVIRASWFNTVELTKMIEYLDGFNIGQANLLTISYIAGMRKAEDSTDLTKDASFYEVHVKLEEIAGDGISFSHN